MSDELHIPGQKNYFVEILSDDRNHGIIVGRFDRWRHAAQMYDDLVADRPLMRVVMRHMSHVYRNYPARQDNSFDRGAGGGRSQGKRTAD